MSWVNTGESTSRKQKCTARRPGLTSRRSSDTWNEPHTEHVADQTTASAQPQYTSQYTPQHTSHTRAPPSSPPRHVNDSGHQPTNTPHAPALYSRPDALPAAQSETTYRRTSTDLASPYRPATFTEIPPQNPPSRSGIESFLRRPNQEEEARNNALNQSILDTNSQVIDSDSDHEDMSRPRRAANTAANTVDLTQSPSVSTTHQSRTRKRESSSDGGSAKKRARQVVVDDDDAFEDEAPSAEAELLQAQQADALKMQETNKEDAVVKIGKRNCIICLENYTNATTASCGKHPGNGVRSRITILTTTLRPHFLSRMSNARPDGFGKEQRPWQGKLPGLQKGPQSEEGERSDPDQLFEEECFQDQGPTSAQQMTGVDWCQRLHGGVG
jgi:hypothetical protein